MTKQNALIGGGVDILFGDTGNPNEYETMVNLDDIEIETQVREEFEDEENDLSELGRSLRVLQIQAIVVRLNRPGREKPYLLIAGERRYRGAIIEGLTQLRARVIELTDEQAEDVQLAENIHRKNLTQIEEAKKIQRDLDSLGSVEAVLEKHHKGRPWLSKILSLLNLPEQTKRLVTENVSADIEVINTVKTIEKIDPDKAKELVDDLKENRGKVNARDKVGAVKDEVKPKKQKRPKESESGDSKIDGNNFAGAKIEQQGNDEYQALQLEMILNAAYFAIYGRSEKPQKVLDGMEAEEKETIEHYLNAFYDAGTQSKNVGQAVIKGLREGHFSCDGGGAFALVSFLHGVDSEAKFSLLNVFGSVKE